MPRYRPSELAKLGIHAKKSLSQNFLIDKNILDKIASTANVSGGDHILEVGPGPGALTEHLLDLGAHVTAIETDARMIQALRSLQTPDNRLTLLEADALETPLPEGHKLKVVANLPYHIATPLTLRYITQTDLIESITVMVQKEVASRMCAKPNTPDYSSLTIFIQAHADATLAFTVKPSSFTPRPKVDSAVVHLKLHPFPFDFPPDPFFEMTKAAFNQRRKMLRASLRDLYPPEKVEQALISIGHKPTARPQELTLQEFAGLFRCFFPLES